MNGVAAVANLIATVLDLVRLGKSDDEIRQALADPTGVGQQLIDAARERSSKIDNFVKNG